MHGTEILNLDLGLLRHFQFPFIKTKVNKINIASRFFKNKFNLLINLKEQLIVVKTKLYGKSNFSSISLRNTLSTIYKSNIEICFLGILIYVRKPNSIILNTMYDVKHIIITERQPVHFKGDHLDPKCLKIVKEELKFMLEIKQFIFLTNNGQAITHGNENEMVHIVLGEI